MAIIIHDDLKPENIFIRNKDIPEIDWNFGLIKIEKTLVLMWLTQSLFIGHLKFIKIPYDVSVDIWSIGCIIA